MWHPRCLSTLLSTLFLLSTSVFHFCYLIYPSSISTDMGNKWDLNQPICLHDFYGSVCIPRSDPWRWSRTMLSMYLSFGFICLFVCFCLYCPVAQKVHHWWDPAFCCVWCLGSKRFLLSLFVWSLVLLILYVDTLWWCVREVHLPLYPALMWHQRCLSTVSTFVMYLCCLHMFSIIFF